MPVSGPSRAKRQSYAEALVPPVQSWPASDRSWKGVEHTCKWRTWPDRRRHLALRVRRAHRARRRGTPPAPDRQGPKPGRFQARAVTPARLAPPPTSSLGLARFNGPGPAVWFTSCHGGTGASTLATLYPGGTCAGRYWPVPEPPGQARVVLVARTHASGLIAAQAAARQWAAGVLPGVRLLGVVAVADAPGKRPKPLKELLRLISGGVPQVWELPWVEALRLGDPSTQVRLPSPYARLTQDLDRIISEDAHA
ncbi:DUF6668 family protein [Actinomadura madurae]|uniref:DUF6668 family protein n=1 Tax=Actinomadura madurae TaxID=1993 RepID=UPI0020D211D6|nr:DUF6668 family protein [Actinomadura madurae]MCP9951738.1 hypothetical protein [Actinomadura madurae]MCP9968509.1 hypothetical protein [Actinomadura madurae]MCP9980977.1 hypothetical protein [Actinomadura madurae]